MDANGWILLCIVAFCVFALIIISKKRRELEKSMTYETGADKGVSTPPPESEPGSDAEGPQQVTIYEFRSASKTCLCALCDGENDASATHCRICGQKLD